MNLWVPPWIVRRLVIAPLVLLLGVVTFVTLPLLLIAAAGLSFWIPGRWRALRLLGFALAYLALECLGMVLLLCLWVLSGFGWQLRSERFTEAHYRLLRWSLAFLHWYGCRLFKLTVVADGQELPAYDGDPTTEERPLIVMSRHAGPGDSFLLIHEIFTWAGRRPRIVLKDTLRLDPFIDITLSRLPSQFVRAGTAQQETLKGIRDMAESMEVADAFVIFPEGGNFTEDRRERAIAKLKRSGLHRQAAKAERLRFVLPPRVGGVGASLDGCPGADVVVVGHTGLDRLNTPRDIWRELPMDKVLLMKWKRVAAEDVPTQADDRVAWLYDLWCDLDDWIEDQQELQDEGRGLWVQGSDASDR